ncbi:MAG: phosphatase PAP2 family protein [Planctomycetes bacterium]|nr:phosphatase PAP2 family protein [Planctomycetota bacterium]
MTKIHAPFIPSVARETDGLRPHLLARVERATRAKAIVLAVAMGLNVWAMFQLPERISFATGWWAPLPTILILAGAGLICTYQKWTRTGLFFCALAWVASAGVSEIHALYAVATFGSPLADSWLAGIDASLGFCVADVKAWADSLPYLRNVLAVLYDGIIVETFLVLFLLSLKRDRVSLNRFVIGFMLCEPALLVFFALMPAAGPFDYYAYDATPMQGLYLGQLEALRGAGPLHVAVPTGLVTFPSFHTTWAILLACALWRHKGWFAFGIVVNALIVLATLTTGWHYLSDLLGGIILAGVVGGVAVLLCPHPSKHAT